MHKLLKRNLFLILFAFVLFFACRKTEKVITETKPVIETNFFNTHVSTDAYVQKITAYVNRQNDKYNFLRKAYRKYWLSLLG
jgi:hypothetical protein